MESIPRLALLLSGLLVIPPSSAEEIELEKPSSKLRRFATDVIFEVEAGDREKYSKRLPASIVVEIHGEPAPAAVAEKHVNSFCELTGVKKLDTLGPEPAAKIAIYFGPQAELARTARELSPEISLDRGFTFWKWWSKDDRTIKRAVVFLAMDKLAGAELEDKLIEQLLGVFGLPSRSREFEASCLSAEEQVLTSLQPVDKALLGFYYRAVPSGTKPRDFDKIFRDQWAPKP